MPRMLTRTHCFIGGAVAIAIELTSAYWIFHLYWPYTLSILFATACIVLAATLLLYPSIGPKATNLSPPSSTAFSPQSPPQTPQSTTCAIERQTENFNAFLSEHLEHVIQKTLRGIDAVLEKTEPAQDSIETRQYKQTNQNTLIELAKPDPEALLRRLIDEQSTICYEALPEWITCLTNHAEFKSQFSDQSLLDAKNKIQACKPTLETEAIYPWIDQFSTPAPPG